MMICCLPLQGTPRHPNIAADTAHSAHSTQPALRSHRATPRVEDKSPQTRRPHSISLCSPLSEGPDPGSGQRHVLDSRERAGYSQDGWRRSSSANKNSVLRKEYRREDQYLSIEIQPYDPGAPVPLRRRRHARAPPQRPALRIHGYTHLY